MESYFRSDLACESKPKNTHLPKGAEEKTRSVGGFSISSLRIFTEEAERQLGRAVGSYLTVTCGEIHRLSEEKVDLLASILSGELRGMARRLTGKKLTGDFSVFVAGLGNRDLTADSIGPLTVQKLGVTRHLAMQEQDLYLTLGCSSLSALSPGVLGQTGIETAELLGSIVKRISPDLVLVIDALAAGDCQRLSSTVQLTDTGISPGAGIGNRRERLDVKSLGVPVIAMGVPTVVDSSTLVWDVLRKAGWEKIDPSLEAVLEGGRHFFVSPKESDLIVGRVSDLFARAIALAFTGALSEIG